MTWDILAVLRLLHYRKEEEKQIETTSLASKLQVSQAIRIGTDDKAGKHPLGLSGVLP